MKSIAFCMLLAAAGAAEQADPAIATLRPLVIATTTSVRDTGLMDVLLPRFMEQTGRKVQLVAAGSGAALAMGEKGDADVLLTHDPDGERALVAKGVLIDRREVAENFFLIAGPPDDPAGIAKASDAADALRRLAAARAPYASRADDSGTHKREQALMRQAGLDPASGWQGVLRTGQGMGATLQVAGEKRAYALSDASTFESFRASTGLAPVFDARTPDLRNVYAVSRPNPERISHGRIDPEGGKQLLDYLASPEALETIGSFRGDGDAPLFRAIAPR